MQDNILLKDISRTILTDERNSILRLTEYYQKKYPSIREFLVRDIALFTLYKYMMQEDELANMDRHDLAINRRFDDRFFKERGICYMDLSMEMARFPFLKRTSILTSESDCYMDRYLLPICTENGDVLTHMGYDRTRDRGKYEIPRLPWISQVNLLGNLESLTMYDGMDIYICEGMFDAYRCNERLNSKAIATLGVTGSKVNRAIWDKLKRKGHRLIYVQDHNDAGLVGKSNYKWDDFLSYPQEFTDYDDYWKSLLESEFENKELQHDKILEFVDNLGNKLEQNI